MEHNIKPVSYTHLKIYKDAQVQNSLRNFFDPKRLTMLREMSCLLYTSDFFYAFLEPHTAYRKANNNNNNHGNEHLYRICLHIGKCLADTCRIKPRKLPCGHFIAVNEHPSPDGCIKHHQQIISCHFF